MSDQKRSNKDLALSALNKALGELKSGDNTPLSRGIVQTCILDTAAHVSAIAELKRERRTGAAKVPKPGARGAANPREVAILGGDISL